MRRRLLLLTAFTSALVVAVMIIAVLPLMRTQVTDQLDQQMRGEILAVAGFLLANSPTDDALRSYLAEIDTTSGTTIGIRTADLTYIGRGATGVAQRWPVTITLDTGATRPIVHLDPRFYNAANGDRIASQGVFMAGKSWIVEGTITHQVITDQQRRHWTLIAVAGIIALLLALITADTLARRIIKPLKTAVRATEAIGQGNLNTHIPTGGPQEVVELGVALNHLSARIERLLTAERERATTLSHRLRTPLTVLALETERLEQELTDRPEQLRRVRVTIAELEKGLDDVILESQRTREDGVADRADAVQMLSAHYGFWLTLAETQNRDAKLLIETEWLQVNMTTQQLGTTLDALFSNIFRHTPPGAAYQARIYRKNGRIGVIELSNREPERHSTPLRAGGIGSTGMGLKLANQAVEAAGGTMKTLNRDGEIVITLELPLVSRATPQPLPAAPIPAQNDRAFMQSQRSNSGASAEPSQPPRSASL